MLPFRLAVVFPICEDGGLKEVYELLPAVCQLDVAKTTELRVSCFAKQRFDYSVMGASKSMLCMVLECHFFSIENTSGERKSTTRLKRVGQWAHERKASGRHRKTFPFTTNTNTSTLQTHTTLESDITVGRPESVAIRPAERFVLPQGRT